MPRRYTVTDLVLRCQQRVNMENDPSISSTRVAEPPLRGAWRALLIVFEVGNEYFEHTEPPHDGRHERLRRDR